MKKKMLLMIVSIATIFAFVGCNSTIKSAQDAPQMGNSNEEKADVQPETTSFDLDKNITVISREDGSGTRGAFIELFGIEVKNSDGTKKDMTTKDADIVNKTDVMMTSVSTNNYSVGYVSLGSLNDTVKAVDIEGVPASAENIKNGTYAVSRPFNIAYKGEPTGSTGLIQDFIAYILSAEGQEVVSSSYIAVNDKAEEFVSEKPEGKIVVAGSSSVSPIMEKLKEAYEKINPNATIEMQMSDSSAGMASAMDGTCDIGMASRDLKDSEKEQLTSVAIALDGIAVIVNQENTMTNLTKEQVRQIFTGETAKWSEIK